MWFLQTLLGAICAVMGALAALWFQSKLARKVRFEETLGERKVAIYQKALLLAMQLHDFLIQGTAKEVLDFTAQHHAR